MEDIKSEIALVIKELFDVEVEPVIDRPDEQFGDITTNVALQLAGRLNKNPREIAEAIKPRLEELPSVAEVSIAGPGFINLRLSDEALQQEIHKILDQKEAYGRSQRYEGKIVVAEYSDPNPFKVLHAGHLYTSLTGDAIARILEVAGATVHRVNFGGDVGLHVGRAMWAIIKNLGGEYPEKLEQIPEDQRLDWVSGQYVIGNEAYETDEIAKEEIIACNKKVYQLHEEGDKTSSFAQIYWTCRQWSYDGFDELYKKLEMVSFERYYPESLTTPLGVKTVQEGLQRGIFEESDGAVVYRGEKEGLHTRVFLTSAGLPTYEAKDLGLALHKWQDYQFDLSFMITGNDIIEYMKVVQAALKHINPEITKRTKHLTHGMIKLAGGQKMSSRKGNILRAFDVLEFATAANKTQTGQDNYLAVLAAVKYTFLRQRIGGDIIYDPAESVNILGNSGPYLQYAHARAVSILQKQPNAGQLYDYQLEKTERSLVRKLSLYPEAIEACLQDLMPHHLCTYLYELAQEFNSFYEQNRVLGDEREVYRLTLVSAYVQVLKNGLGILGITAPDHM